MQPFYFKSLFISVLQRFYHQQNQHREKFEGDHHQNPHPNLQENTNPFLSGAISQIPKYQTMYRPQQSYGGSHPVAVPSNSNFSEMSPQFSPRLSGMDRGGPLDQHQLYGSSPHRQSHIPAPMGHFSNSPKHSIVNHRSPVPIRHQMASMPPNYVDEELAAAAAMGTKSNRYGTYNRQSMSPVQVENFRNGQRGEENLKAEGSNDKEDPGTIF